MKEIYLVDLGVLMSKDCQDYESYNVVYDKKHGYFDEVQFMTTNKEFAINETNKYVKDGVINTYGVITTQKIEEDSLYEEILELEKDNPYQELLDWSYCEYEVENVVYDIYKNDEKIIIENFIEREV